MKLSKTTTILLVILAVVAVIAAVVIFRSLAGVPSDEDILTEGGVVLENPDETVFLSLASQIESVSFDSSFFNDRLFMSLTDISVTVVPEQVGRRDPFANISGIVPTQ